MQSSTMPASHRIFCSPKVRVGARSVRTMPGASDGDRAVEAEDDEDDDDDPMRIEGADEPPRAFVRRLMTGGVPAPQAIVVAARTSKTGGHGRHDMHRYRPLRRGVHGGTREAAVGLRSSGALVPEGRHPMDRIGDW